MSVCLPGPGRPVSVCSVCPRVPAARRSETPVTAYPLTRRSAVNERIRERWGGKDARDGRPAPRRRGKALSGRLTQSGGTRNPLRILAIKRATPGALWPGISRELVGRSFRDREGSSPKATRTYDTPVNSRSHIVPRHSCATYRRCGSRALHGVASAQPIPQTGTRSRAHRPSTGRPAHETLLRTRGR